MEKRRRQCGRAGRKREGLRRENSGHTKASSVRGEESITAEGLRRLQKGRNLFGEEVSLWCTHGFHALLETHVLLGGAGELWARCGDRSRRESPCGHVVQLTVR